LSNKIPSHKLYEYYEIREFKLEAYSGADLTLKWIFYKNLKKLNVFRAKKIRKKEEKRKVGII